jgi:alpha-ketoglutarate-dependent taurine dioxygenase
MLRSHNPDSVPRALNAALPNAFIDRLAPDRTPAYLRWRERKLARYPRSTEDLIVEVRDPRNLSNAETGALRRVCGAANMVIYASPLAGVADKDIPRRLGARLGLTHLHANPLSDEDGISSLTAAPAKSARGYIPYSNQRLLWHTDGYYNATLVRIRAFILHCVQPAATGGDNRLLDPEIAYMLLRDADPEYVRALCAPDAMTIPANVEDGGQIRSAQTGPVFSTDATDGALHMRYTSRTRSIEWRSDETTRAALAFLHQALDASPYVFAVRLAGGQGLVCNNVLHNRSAFSDDLALGATRLVYRARYLDRIAEGRVPNAASITEEIGTA